MYFNPLKYHNSIFILLEWFLDVPVDTHTREDSFMCNVMSLKLIIVM